MAQRWRAVGVLAIALFAVNVVARLVIRLGFDGDDSAADRVSLGMFIVIGLMLAGVAFVWGERRRLGSWAGDVAAAIGVAVGLTVLIGPLLVGNNPFAGGGSTFFAQIGLYLVVTTIGTMLGYLLLVTLGRDYRSRNLQRYAETSSAKPRRVVRR
ncbi:hypothetical protein [Micromonospora lutea]|uniref:Integral membrane protein n=1 Tax=Micromonospora lutea TaxID=419825 RepID=A0ABQ4IZ94_9ACTN|nr:hypothetical protein [Micromonospora lutea]GIJ23162.1 hypothetical protein Vlu01_37860 [Micromonospora lutea]